MQRTAKFLGCQEKIIKTNKQTNNLGGVAFDDVDLRNRGVDIQYRVG
jgi:hypothetical protein